MKETRPLNQAFEKAKGGKWLLLIAIIFCCAIYSTGLSGSFLFDDYPNIVDNKGVQLANARVSSQVGAALSSPSSEFKRPLASLSFAANYLLTGLDPYWMKLTNLIIHLLNGLMVYVLANILLEVSYRLNLAKASRFYLSNSARKADPSETDSHPNKNAPPIQETSRDNFGRTDIIAALVAASWMLLPINLTAVLYVVQRMESIANLFVLIGLTGYVIGRRHMLEKSPTHGRLKKTSRLFRWTPYRGFYLCTISITVPAAIGIMAKETAIMLPLYALLIEWAMFRFLTPVRYDDTAFDTGIDKIVLTAHPSNIKQGNDHSLVRPSSPKFSVSRDWRVISLFSLVFLLPLVIGLIWLLPGLLNPASWETRDFTLATRLMSEARIVSDYVLWTLLPNFEALSFYHDDFSVSTGLLTPWTTLGSLIFLASLAGLMLWLRHRLPLASLGIALFFACHLLTGTIIPLELIYEHRNYFASFGLMLTVVPLLATGRSTAFALCRYVLLGGLMLCWSILTAISSYAWGSPLRLAEDLASRAPRSPRAQYELGRTYIIYSQYDPASPFTKLAYAPLEKSAALPGSSILPEQALIFMNSRMKLPLKNIWWNSLIDKLKNHKPTVQDESSLAALTQCVREGHCDLPKQRMMQAYLAALSHPDPSARLLAMYGDYAWNVLNDHPLGERMTDAATKAAPKEPAYRITLVRMLAAQGREEDARAALHELQALNIGGSLDTSLNELRALPGM